MNAGDRVKVRVGDTWRDGTVLERLEGNRFRVGIGETYQFNYRIDVMERSALKAVVTYDIPGAYQADFPFLKSVLEAALADAGLPQVRIVDGSSADDDEVTGLPGLEANEVFVYPVVTETMGIASCFRRLGWQVANDVGGEANILGTFSRPADAARCAYLELSRVRALDMFERTMNSLEVGWPGLQMQEECR